MESSNEFKMIPLKKHYGAGCQKCENHASTPHPPSEQGKKDVLVLCVKCQIEKK